MIELFHGSGLGQCVLILHGAVILVIHREEDLIQLPISINVQLILKSDDLSIHIPYEICP